MHFFVKTNKKDALKTELLVIISFPSPFSTGPTLFLGLPLTPNTFALTANVFTDVFFLHIIPLPSYVIVLVLVFLILSLNIYMILINWECLEHT